MSLSRTGWLFAIALGALGAYVGCGGDDGGGGGGGDTGGGGSPDGQSGGGDLQILFSPMYSGYDGVHTFQIPVTVVGLKNATFSASDDSYVSIEKTGDGAMITTKKAGQVDIIARAGSLTGTARLTITPFTEAEWEAGKERYTNGEPFRLPTFDPCRPPTTIPTISDKLSCTNCHGTTASFGDVEHTPMQTGGYSDEDLVNIFTNGMKPEGGEMHTLIPARIWQMFHKWSVTEQEKKGIIAYLRSLTPKSQGQIDYGNFARARGDGGSMRPQCDGGTPASGMTTTTDAGVGG